jgi:hypothetical protein
MTLICPVFAIDLEANQSRQIDFLMLKGGRVMPLCHGESTLHSFKQCTQK